MLSFVFLTVTMHPLVEVIWRHFFKHCPAGTEAVVLSKNLVLPKWGVPTRRAKFVHPDYNLRFTREMVDLMNAGAMASQPDSTVLFVSDTSVPLKSCATITSNFDTQTVVALQNRLGCIKGSQWMAMPRPVWERAYAGIGNQTRQSNLCSFILYGAPDETLVQTQLYALPERINVNTHAIFWNTNGLAGGHPDTLTSRHFDQALRFNHSLARKFDPTKALYNFDWLKR